MDLSSLRASLMSPDFDVEVHASQIIQQSGGKDVGQYMQDLASAEQELDRLLQDQVSSHYEDLISQAMGVQQLEKHLDMMQTHMGTLVSASERLRDRIREPYKVIRSQTVTLSRLQETCDLLRRIIRILQLGQRLQTQLQGGPQEMAKAALSLNELSELWCPELGSIDVIEQDQRMILHAKADVERSADGLLSRGMESQNQNQIGIAVQVFQNLSILETKLDQTMQSQLQQVKQRLANALDIKKITSAAEEASSSSAGKTTKGATTTTMQHQPGKASGMTNMAAFRAVLWNNIESVLDFIFGKTVEVLCLQRLLSKKRDAVTHASFVDILKRSGILAEFWNKLVLVVAENFSNSAAESNFMKQALEGEYPKLLRLFNALWGRLHVAATDVIMAESGDTTDNKGSSSNAENNDNNNNNPFRSVQIDPALTDTLRDFETAYLGRSLSRLFDPVGLMFSAGDVPSDSELQQVFKGISAELNVSSVDPHLSRTVGRNVCKTIQLMCVKCEQILVTDGEASQIVGNPSEGQRRNVAIVNCLSKFRSGVENILLSSNSIDKEVAASIAEALEAVDRQVRNAVYPMLQSVQDAVEAIILTIHKEDFSKDNDNENVNNDNNDGSTSGASRPSCSLYMKELQGFLSRVATDFLQDFICQELVASCVMPVAAKCIDQFILHSSLVRPLGRAGQERLASDCAQLELALEPLVGINNIATLSDSYSRLRSFRSLLFTKPEDVPSFVERQKKSLPVSTALHFLFSKAPPELKSPHESAGWSLSRYSRWLEDHPSEDERLQLIQGALESYVAGTRARQEKSYAFPYNIMLQILEAAK